MKVSRNFDRIYRTESDPWQIGKADSERYNLYYELIMANAHSKRKIADIGCGFGVFLSRFHNVFEQLIGVEISEDAIKKGKQKFPFIKFIQGSADNLAAITDDKHDYDFIIFSDVIYYLNEKGKNASLEWIASHLSEDGLAFVAAWCPGGDYLGYDELRRLVRKHFNIKHEHLLESSHGVFLVQKKIHFIAITIDYETWHPIPDGEVINWGNDIFKPAANMLNLCDQNGVKLTFMAEMGEYFWLCEHHPDIARLTEEQWKTAIRNGHDVQLHLHPNWLPELGARFENGKWSWDWSKAKANDYPEDLTTLIGKCKSRLETLLCEINPEYRVTSFRAGAYQIQPFRRLYEALVANEIICDSSVYAGGYSEERGYDFHLAYSQHQPYFANSYDPQLKAPPSEQGIAEMPIFTFKPGERWFLDGQEGKLFANRLTRYLADNRDTLSSEWYRRIKLIKKIFATGYWLLKPVHHWCNKVLPKGLAYFMTSYAPEELTGHEYFVMIGHTKGEHYFNDIADNLSILRKDSRFRFVTLSEMCKTAREELFSRQYKNAKELANCQTKRERMAVMGESRNEAQSFYLQDMIPLDRKFVLDLGCGAGYWTKRISDLYPWMNVTGMDYSFEFAAKTKNKFLSARTTFHVGDFANLPFGGDSLDCVYADNVLEHTFVDVDKALHEIYRILSWGGSLIAAIPSDARNPETACDNHTWKTATHEVKMRLETAGFVNVEIEEIDVFRKLGMPPYPPSFDKMMYVRAWKRIKPATSLERALEAMRWVYDRLDPADSFISDNPAEIIKNGHALCWGYAIVLGKLLQREGFYVKWLTMLAKNHPKGRGGNKVDSHEVILVKIDGKDVIMDPTTNTLIPYSLIEVLNKPSLAQKKYNPDARYASRCYDMYATEFWYSRVHKYLIRSDPDELSTILKWKKNAKNY